MKAYTLAIAALSVWFAAPPAEAAISSLLNPPFSWGYYGAGLGPSKIWVTD